MHRSGALKYAWCGHFYRGNRWPCWVARVSSTGETVDSAGPTHLLPAFTKRSTYSCRLTRSVAVVEFEGVRLLSGDRLDRSDGYAGNKQQ